MAIITQHITMTAGAIVTPNGIMAVMMAASILYSTLVYIYISKYTMIQVSQLLLCLPSKCVLYLDTLSQYYGEQCYQCASIVCLSLRVCPYVSMSERLTN